MVGADDAVETFSITFGAVPPGVVQATAAGKRLGTTEITVDHNRASRRSFLALATATPLVATALASCGDSGPAGSSSGDTATDWILSGQPKEGIRQTAVDDWNKAHDDQQIKTSSFQNDAYKAKIKTAIGAGQAPTIIFGWGG
ncbi:hypothetical protein CLV37_1061, partial [Kineococcus rhizosphaerae]